MPEMAIKIDSFGDVARVSLQLALAEIDGIEVSQQHRSMMIPAEETRRPPRDLDIDDFPPPDGPRYMPNNPADWAWLASGWFVLKIADTVVEDVAGDLYERLKAVIRRVRAEHPEARLKVDDPLLADVAAESPPTG